jgi:hypothetical protein
MRWKPVLSMGMALTGLAGLLAGCATYQEPLDCDPALGAATHTCPDGSQVPWCACTRTGWQCVDSPEALCPGACDDGSDATCEMLTPECESWELLAVQNSCWVCVDPATCQPWGLPGCVADGDCRAEQRCDLCASSSCPECDDCVAGCRDHGCPTQGEHLLECRMARPECGPDGVAVIEQGCWTCLSLADCAAMRDESCDDGSQALCDMIPPVCEPHEILAVQNDCWVCVNPATCQPWGEAGCKLDADCDPHEWCDPCASGSCPMCPDCVAGCGLHGCPSDGYDQLECAMPRPDCDFGFSVIMNGCWVCVTPDSCSPIERDTSCDDGTEPLCMMPTPVCEGHEILAIQDNCWVCVNPASCAPWGVPGCETDQACEAHETCDPCATSSCPDCDDCLAACRHHGCPTETELQCYCARPDCGAGAVSIIDQGCWICLDRVSCQPTGQGC